MPLLLPAPEREGCIFGLAGQKNRNAPWEKIRNASDRMFVTLTFGSRDNLYAIWDILYFYPLTGVIYYLNITFILSSY